MMIISIIVFFVFLFILTMIIKLQKQVYFGVIAIFLFLIIGLIYLESNTVSIKSFLKGKQCIEQSNQRYIEDFMFIYKSIKEGYSYLEEKQEKYGFDWEDLKNETLEEVMSCKDDKTFFRIITKFLANLHDGHTYVMQPLNSVKALPIIIEKIQDKFVVSKTYFDKYPKIKKGYEVVSINGIKLKEIIETSEKYITGSTERQAEKKRLIHIYETLNFFIEKNIDYTKKAKLLLKDVSGNLIEVKVEWISYSDYYKLYLGDVPKLEVKWLDEDKKIAYLAIRSFAVEGNNEFLEFIDKVFKDYSEMKGFVIDIRSNQGGLSYFPNYLIRYLIDSPIADLKYRFKLSQAFHKLYYMGSVFNGVEGYTEWIDDGLIKPKSNNVADIPKILLIDELTFSAADRLASIIADYEIATIVGENGTGGGSGEPIRTKLPNTRWYFSYSAMQIKRKNEALIEGNGVEPNILVKRNFDDFIENQDTVLKKAIEIIENEIEY